METSNLDFVSDYIRKRDLKYYRLYPLGKQTVVDSNCDGADPMAQTVDDCISGLVGTLQNVTGKFQVRLWCHWPKMQEKDDARNRSFVLNVNTGGSSPTAPAGFGVGSVGQPGLFEMLILQMKENSDLQMKLLRQELTAQNSSGQSKVKDAAMLKGVLVLEKLVGKFIDGDMVASAPAVAGVDVQTVSAPGTIKIVDMNKEEKTKAERLSLAFNNIQKVYPDLLDTMEKLSEIALNDPDKLNLAISTLRQLAGV